MKLVLVFSAMFISGINPSVADESTDMQKTKEFQSPDKNITIIVNGEPNGLGIADFDNFIVRVSDTRNGGILLPLSHYENAFEETGNVSCEWYWNSTALRFNWSSETGKNSIKRLYILRKDARSGIYYFDVPNIPSFYKLKELLLTLTQENRDAIHTTPDSDHHFGGRSRFELMENSDGHFVVTLAVAENDRDDLIVEYIFTFHTPDWIRYDLLQIRRGQGSQGGGPGAPFIAPDADDVLLYQAPAIPEDLRWRPAHAGPDAYPGSSVDLTKDDNESPDTRPKK